MKLLNLAPFDELAFALQTVIFYALLILVTLSQFWEHTPQLSVLDDSTVHAQSSVYTVHQ